MRTCSQSRLKRPKSGEPGIALGLRARFAIFRTIEWLSDMRSRRRLDLPPPAAGQAQAVPQGHRHGSVWVFASTIGELALIEPLLQGLLRTLPGLPLTLITDHAIYRETYARKFPDSYVYTHDGSTRATTRLLANSPPMGGIVVEIPCLPSDAPCRLPFSVLFALRRLRVPVALLNGWLYGYQAPSRLDRLERRLFTKDYVRSFDLITVQADEVRAQLVAAGADPTRIHVTGNTKFDALSNMGKWSPAGRPSERLLTGLIAQARPMLVAGCVTDAEGQEFVLDAFTGVLARHPGTLLVLAPRHPENVERTARLLASLQRRGMKAALRSGQGDVPLATDTQCLVLDTFGELKDFYAASAAAHVGRNHNLLEPLAYGKPVTTSGTWETTYPSFPVYRALSDVRLIDEVDSPSALCAAWLEALQAVPSLRRHPAEAIASLTGATAKNLALLEDALIKPLRERA